MRKIALFLLPLFLFPLFPMPVSAQTCSFIPVSTPLNDLGPNEYLRLTTTNPPTYLPTGLIGGLYPGGSNQRPPAHDLAGLSFASQIQPINGKIGLVSIGMSNTSSEFSRFVTMANADATINDNLVIVNGALSGGTVERWISSSDPNINYYWSNLNQKIAQAGLSDSQVQVIWLKITQADRFPFPTNIDIFESRLEQLVTMLKTKFPNLKITYLSSRVRSYAYVAAAVAEPAAFENGFGIRNLIAGQIDGLPERSFDAVSYLAWGPYLWIDGTNPRSDGRIWPITNLMSDCVHPTTDGNQAVADMLMEFFKSDTTATPWFLNPGVPTPTPSPVPPTPTPGPTSTPTPIPPTPTPTTIPTPTPIPPTPTPTIIPTPTPTVIPGSPISTWTFPTNTVTDDINGCTGCANFASTWFTPSIVSGGFNFDGLTSYLNLGTFPYLNNSSAFTLSVWIKPAFDHTSTSWRYLFNDGSNVNIFYLSNINDWRVNVRTSTNTTIRVDSQNLTWTPNTWHHLAVSLSNTALKLYWDGVLIGTTPNTGSVAGESGATYLGKSIQGQYFSGAIDQLKIFNYALDDSQITQLFATP